MKNFAALLLLTSACLATPKSPHQVVQDVYGEIAKRRGNYLQKADELQQSSWVEASFKRELIAQLKGDYKKDGRWLIDFALLTSLQTATPTKARALPAKISGKMATVPVELTYIDGVREKLHTETLNVHLQQNSAGWQIDNVFYTVPHLKLKDAMSYLKWAKDDSGHK